MSIKDKILKSGLVEKHTVQMLVGWGYLKEGDELKVPEANPLVNATKEHLKAFAEDIEGEIEKSHRLRETTFDLEKMRWPAEIEGVFKTANDESPVAFRTSALIDRMGRLYFRSQDVRKEWFVPGYLIFRHVKIPEQSGNRLVLARYTILESTTLFIGETPVCVQVSVDLIQSSMDPTL